MTKTPGVKTLFQSDRELLELKDGLYYLWIKSKSTGEWYLYATHGNYKFVGGIWGLVRRVRGQFRIDKIINYKENKNG